jgi:hypothetical protein
MTITSPDPEPIMKKSLQNLFGEERDRSRKAKEDGVPLSRPEESSDIDGYRAENAAIPSRAYESLDIDSMLPKDFKNYWGNNSLCCAVFLPFDDGANNKAQMQIQDSWDSFVADRRFLRLLTVMPTSKLTQGFGSFADTPARYFELLPEELRRDVDDGGCTFEVKYANPRQLDDSADRAWFIAQCEKAIQNLRRYLASGNLLESLN